MSSTYGTIRISKSPNMANAYTLPGVRNIGVVSSDWNASADRGVDRIRIEYLGIVYTLKFTLPMQIGPTVISTIKNYTRDLEFYVEYYNPEEGKRLVMKVYRAQTEYNYIGEGNDLWDETDYEWIGVYTLR